MVEHIQLSELAPASQQLSRSLGLADGDDLRQPLILRLGEIQIHSTAPVDDRIFQHPSALKVSGCSPKFR